MIQTLLQNPETEALASSFLDEMHKTQNRIHQEQENLKALKEDFIRTFHVETTELTRFLKAISQ